MKHDYYNGLPDERILRPGTDEWVLSHVGSPEMMKDRRLYAGPTFEPRDHPIPREWVEGSELGTRARDLRREFMKDCRDYYGRKNVSKKDIVEYVPEADAGLIENIQRFSAIPYANLDFSPAVLDAIQRRSV